MSGAGSATAVASVEGLTVRYGREVALDRVSLTVERGEVYALLGRNGAGKSSLVRCLLGQQRPSAGSSELFGRGSWRTRTEAMRHTGVVPETPDMPPAMTARQLEGFCAGLYPRWDGDSVRRRLERFGVPLATPAGRLSKGQKAQLSLSLALGHTPELLVLDDPTLGLDAVARQTVFGELVEELADHGSTVFLTTHDLAGVEGIADRVGILRDGRLVVDEPLEALKARSRRIVAARAATGTDATTPMEPPPFASVRELVRGWRREWIVGDFDERALATWCARTDLEVETVPMTLEEIFIALVGEPTGGEQ